MKVERTPLPGVLVIEPEVFRDARGLFFETYNQPRYDAAGVPTTFVQDNHSRSVEGTLRGLHYQLRRPQAKLVRVLRGEIWDVVVDIRAGSPTFGRWTAVELSADNFRQLFVPPGFAHGFCIPTGEAEVEYKCSDVYVPDDQHGVAWNDASLALPWPVRHPLLSRQDAAFPPLSPGRGDLPRYYVP